MELGTITSVLMQLGAVDAGGKEALAEAAGLAGGSLGIAAILALLLALKAGLIGSALWFAAAYSRPYEHMCMVYQTQGSRCFFVGVIDAVAGLLLVILLMATKVLGLLGVLLFLALGAMVVAGYGVAYRNLGRRLVPDDVPDAQVRSIALGGVTMEAAFLVPVIGQILRMGVLFRGLGAVCITLLAWHGISRDAETDGASTDT